MLLCTILGSVFEWICNFPVTNKVNYLELHLTYYILIVAFHFYPKNSLVIVRKHHVLILIKIFGTHTKFQKSAKNPKWLYGHVHILRIERLLAQFHGVHFLVIVLLSAVELGCWEGHFPTINCAIGLDSYHIFIMN